MMLAGRTPLGHALPSATELVALVRERGLVSLHDLALAVWPGLTWAEAGEPWIFPAAGYPRSAHGRRCWTFEPTWPEATVRQTAVAWLSDRLQDLVLQGTLEHGPRRAALDRVGQVTYQLARRPQTVDHRAAWPLVLMLLACGVAHAADDVPAQVRPVAAAPVAEPQVVAALGLLALLTLCVAGRRG